MKTKLSILPVALLILCSPFIQGCGQDDKDKSQGYNTFFYEQTKDSTPVYSPAAVSRSAKALATGGEWSADNAGILYSVFFTLRDYQYPDDEGVVDRSNLYKLLFDAETTFTSAYNQAQALPDLPIPVRIESPFSDIEVNYSLFTKAANIEDDKLCVAYTETEQRTDALITWKVFETNEPDKAETGIAYFIFFKDTQDIYIDMVYSVDYDISTPATDYNLRCQANGNAVDHSFKFNYLIDNYQIIATGVSQGEGNYMVFKFDDGDGPYYLRVPANAGEEYFKNIFESNNEGIETDPTNIDDPLNYLAWIESEPFMTSASLLSDTTQLNVGISGLAGTINLDF